MTAWRSLKGTDEEAIFSCFHIRVDTATGKGSLQPGGWYSSFNTTGTPDQMRDEAIRMGYERLASMMQDYRAEALAAGIALAPPTIIG